MQPFAHDSKSGRLAIQGELTIYQAAAAREACIAARDSGALREVDLSGVTELDTAGLQLLLQVSRIDVDQQRRVQLTGHSQAVREALLVAGLANELGLDAQEEQS